MKEFLTEWLIRYGTEWADRSVVEQWSDAIGINGVQRQSCAHRGYLNYAIGHGRFGGLKERYQLTPKGLEYIKNESIPD